MHGMKASRFLENWGARSNLAGIGLASALRANAPQISRRLVGI